MKKKKKICGMLAMEPILMMLIFIFTMVLINNAIVSVIQQEWTNVAESAALAGVGKLYEERGKPNDQQDALNEALQFALLHSWLEGPIQSNQVIVTLGEWDECEFTTSNNEPNAVRVDLSAPKDASGNSTGIVTLFGTFDLPFFQKLNTQVTAVAAVYGKTAVLVEYQGSTCFDDE